MRISVFARQTVTAITYRSLFMDQAKLSRPIFISTWSFGKAVNDEALRVFRATGSMLNAIEQGIWTAESDPNVDSVGLGGIPNADGVVQLDACMMSGPGHRAGAVCALEEILHPISVARMVMERTEHVMLAGEGAKQFAIASGFERVALLTDKQREKWAARRLAQNSDPTLVDRSEQPQLGNHDTVTILGLDAEGNLFGGCSTSGRAHKLPGRVGDSPIIGSGLYVDNEIGAAGATGTGENVMRYCATFQIVELMRDGISPQTAIERVIRRIVDKDSKSAAELAINFIALDKTGRYGAAGTSKGFQFTVTTESSSELSDAISFTDSTIELGGNKQ